MPDESGVRNPGGAITLRNGRGMDELLALDKMKAFGQALIHALREGLEVVVGGSEVSVAGTIGDDVPIEYLAASPGLRLCAEGTP